MRNVNVFLDYIHMTKYSQINEKYSYKHLTRKKEKKRTCHYLHKYTQAHFTHHNTLLHTHMIEHKTKIATAYHMHKKIFYKTKLSQYTQVHTRTLDTSFNISTYNSITATV